MLQVTLSLLPFQARNSPMKLLDFRSSKDHNPPDRNFIPQSFVTATTSVCRPQSSNERTHRNTEIEVDSRVHRRNFKDRLRRSKAHRGLGRSAKCATLGLYGRSFSVSSSGLLLAKARQASPAPQLPA